MRLVVIANLLMQAEFRAKFAKSLAGWDVVFLMNAEDLAPHLEQTEVVFDFLLEGQRERLQCYAAHEQLVVFMNAVLVQLAAVAAGMSPACKLFGFNGLPTLFNRPVLEVSLLHIADAEKLQAVCEQLGTEYHLVADRVGMVTPRILCMIINEACYTLQEGTAACADIDVSMKLGTNYPRGPFEWANCIGVSVVYQVLQAIYIDTHDERYKICPLLKTKSLKAESFEF